MNNPKNIEQIELKRILPDPHQPRNEFDVVLLDRLAQSIESQGILSPLAIERIEGTNTYLLVDGERRFRAATMLGLKVVPAMVYEPMDAKDRIMTRFHLQELHSNWSAFDKAKAIAIMQQENNLTDREIAELLGLNIKTVQDYLLLLTLSKRSIHVANEHKLPYAHLASVIRVLKEVEDEDQKQAMEIALIKRIKDKVVTKQSEIDTYKIAIREGGKKIIEKIIDNPKLTPAQALEMAGIAESIELKKMVSQLSWTAGWVRRMTATGVNKSITTAEEATLINMRDAVDEFLNTAGAAVPYRK